MSENLLKIQRFIGEKAFNRALEVMDILGIKLPEDFRIYNKPHYLNGLSYDMNSLELESEHNENYAVLFVPIKEKARYDYLKQEDLDRAGYFEFNPYRQCIAFTRNGLFYEWEKMGKDFEQLEIRPGGRYNFDDNLAVVLNRRNEGVNSSDMCIHGVHTSPIICSYIDTVGMKKNACCDIEEAFPIDNYFDLFEGLLTGERYSYIIPKELNNGSILKLFLQIFERPVSELVTDLKNADQSIRFEKEKERILSLYKFQVEQAKEKYDEAKEKAKSQYRYRLQCAELEKSTSLANLYAEQSNYVDSQIEKNKAK